MRPVALATEGKSLAGFPVEKQTLPIMKMEYIFMKLLPAFAAAALAAVSFSAVAAPAGYVSYRCDSGKKLNVMYEFDRDGNAVGAAVNAAGTKANLRVDRNRSDDTGTTFSNKRGYVMSAGYIGRDTHTTSEVVGLNAPGGRFIVKNCEPTSR
nr:adhesin [Neisseria elongata]